MTVPAFDATLERLAAAADSQPSRIGSPRACQQG
jgi:hypothetical protein